MSEPVTTAVREGTLQVRFPEARWLSTGFDGGIHRADAAYNVTVPEGWPETNLGEYVSERRERAGFDATGPALLTGVDQTDARVAQLGSVVAIATAGISNPAALPTDSAELREPEGPGKIGAAADEGSNTGTVNLVVVTERALEPGALANLVAVAAEAKATTLLDRTGFPGTTTDAVIVGCDPDGDPAAFSGSATDVGAAARACVRDAVLAAIDAHYEDEEEIPESVEDAEYGVRTDVRATIRSLTNARRIHLR